MEHIIKKIAEKEKALQEQATALKHKQEIDKIRRDVDQGRPLTNIALDLRLA